MSTEMIGKNIGKRSGKKIGKYYKNEYGSKLMKEIQQNKIIMSEKMSKIQELYRKNIQKFVELCNKPTKDIIEICERYLKDKCHNHYLLDATRSEGSTKTFNIRYSNVNNSNWEPYDIIYRIAYYDNLELKINPYGVSIFEQMEHCAGLETHKEDFDSFALIYNVNQENNGK